MKKPTKSAVSLTGATFAPPSTSLRRIFYTITRAGITVKHVIEMVTWRQRSRIVKLVPGGDAGFAQISAPLGETDATMLHNISRETARPLMTGTKPMLFFPF